MRRDTSILYKPPGRSRRSPPWGLSLARVVIENLVELDEFLSAFPIVPVRPSTGARAYGLLKVYAKSHGLHVFDSLVAATAMEEGLTLITKNRKHFGMIAGLRLDR